MRTKMTTVYGRRKVFIRENSVLNVLNAVTELPTKRKLTGAAD